MKVISITINPDGTTTLQFPIGHLEAGYIGEGYINAFRDAGTIIYDMRKQTTK